MMSTRKLETICSSLEVSFNSLLLLLPPAPLPPAPPPPAPPPPSPPAPAPPAPAPPSVNADDVFGCAIYEKVSDQGPV